MSRLPLVPLVPALFLAACDSDDVIPISHRFEYVVSEASLPTSKDEMTRLGLDLDEDRVPDNQLGSFLALMAADGIDLQGAMTAAIDRGDMILLLDLDLQNKDLTTATRAGFQIKLGDPATAMPPPCANTSDTVCRKHLAGTGSFTVAAGSPEHVPIGGPLSGGTFSGGPGALSLEIALGTQRVQLDLIGARVKASGISETGIDEVVIGGAIPDADVSTKVVPAILEPILMADCPGTTPPDCGCRPGSSGRALLDLLETMPKDCQVSPAEIRAFSEAQDYLSPDVTIDGTLAVSFGLKVQAVRGIF